MAFPVFLSFFGPFFSLRFVPFSLFVFYFSARFLSSSTRAGVGGDL
jgi:hypothetical protein